jgi:outer membrane protein TolC
MRRTILFCAFIGAAGLLSAPAAGQISAFPRPAWFRQHFPAPARVELQPLRRLSDYVAGGNVELSLRAYLELALQNNPDIAVARLQVETSANGITRAMADYDPSLSASFNNTHASSTSVNALEGTPTVKTLSQPFSGSYSQLLPTGTNFSVQYSGQRSSTNAVYATYNPYFSSNLTFGFDQPLLRNRGASLTKLNLTVARSTLRISRYQVSYQVTTLMANAESVYWNVVAARENLALASKFLDLRAAALDRAQKMVDSAAMLPLDIYQSKSEYASAQLGVIQAKRALAEQENALRMQIGADLDPAVRNLPVALTEPLTIPMITPPDKEEAVAKALKARPDYLASAAGLDVDDLGIRRAVEMLKPSVSVTGGYQSQGLGGTFVQEGIPGGFGDALSQMFSFASPQYSIGVRLSLPVRDHAATAGLVDAQIRKKQDALGLRKLGQSLRLQVLNAVEDLEAARASLDQAQLARDFADKRLAAEQKKYELGIELQFFVLTAQTDLNAAEASVLQQSINYRFNLINFYQVTGQLLEERGIAVE